MKNIFRCVIGCSLLIALFSCSPSAEDANVADPVPKFAGKGFAVVAGDQFDDLAWPSIYGATQFTVLWSNQPDLTPATAKRIEVNATHYRHSGLTNGLTYYYAVIAQTDYGQSEMSEILQATPQYPELQAPSQFQVYPGDQRVTLDWTKISQATSYTIFWEKGKTPDPTKSPRIDFVTPPFVHENLQNGSEYQYIVTANIENRIGKATQVLSATPNMPLPLPPGTIKYTRTNTAISLNWRQQDAESYNIYWATSRGVDKNSSLFAKQANRFNHANIDANATYYYRISANKRGVTGELSAEFAIPALLASAEVTLNASGVIPAMPKPNYRVGDRQITLQWPAVTGALAYNVYWSLSPGVNNSSKVINNVKSPYVHTGLTNNVEVYYRLSAQNLAGESALSQEFSAIPEVAQPNVPLNFKLLSGETWIGASWLPVENAEKYFVYYKKQSDPGYASITVGYAPALLDNLQANTSYQVFVEAANLDQSPQQNPLASDKTTAVLTISTKSPPPAPPAELYATPGNRSVSLNWQGAPGLDYRIYRGLGNQASREQIATTAATSFNDTGLSNGVSYSYAIRSIAASGESRSSLVVTVTPQLPQPNAPENVDVVAGDGFVSVNWSQVANTKYNVYVIDNGNDKNRNVFTDAAPIHIVNGLKNGTEYKVYVTAIQVDGLSTAESRKSLEYLVTPHVAAPSSRLTGLFLTSSAGVNDLGWDALPVADGYRVYWSVDQAVDPANSSYDETTSNSYKHIPGNIGEGHIIHYAVAAFNSGGEGPLAYFVPYVQAMPLLPVAPADFSATIDTVNGKPNVVVFDWTPIVGNDSYALYWSTNNNLPLAQWNKINGVQPQDAQQLNYGDTYYYLIAAINGIGETVTDQPQNATPQLPAPGIPGGVVVTPGDSQISLLWEQIPGESYNLRYGLASTAENLVPNVRPMHVISGLTNGSNYLIQLSAVNAANSEGPPTPTYTVAPLATVGNNVPPSFSDGNVRAVDAIVNGQANSWLLSASDPDDAQLIWSIATAPSQGTASIQDAPAAIGVQAISQTKYLVYTPSQTASGTDSVVVSVSDGRGGEAQQTFNINLVAPTVANTAPRFLVTGPVNYTLDNSITPAQGQWDIGVIDDQGDSLTWTVTPAAAQNKVTLSALASLPNGSSDGRHVSYQALANQLDGMDAFAITVNDGKGGSATLNFNVNVMLAPVVALSSASVPSSTTAGQVTTISVTARDSSNSLVQTNRAVVAIRVTGANAAANPLPLPTTFANGVYSASYTPTKAGVDNIGITMSVNGQPAAALTGSPFSTTINPGVLSSVNHNLNPSGTINTAMNFTLTATDAFSNPVTGLLFSATASESVTPSSQNLVISEQGNGVYAVAFTPSVATTYAVNVTYNGASVGNFPQNVLVSDPAAGVPVVANSTASLPTNLTAGQLSTITVTARDIYNTVVTSDQAVVTITVGGANAAANPTALTTTFLNGVYSASYTPTKAGVDTISITMAVNGQPAAALTGSPFSSNIAPAALSSVTHNLNPSGTINTAMDFTLTAMDAYSHPLTGLAFSATASETVTPSSQNLVISEQGNGVYGVAFTPSVATTYAVNVTYNGSSVGNFPQNVLVSDPVAGVPVASTSTASVPTNVVAGQLSTITVTARDIYNTVVTSDQAVVTIMVGGANAAANPTALPTTFLNGVYSASYAPTKAGVDSISITMSVNGQPAAALTGSPFTSTIAPAALSSVTHNLNPSGTINSAMDFTLTAMDAFSNPLTGLAFSATASETVTRNRHPQQSKLGDYRTRQWRLWRGVYPERRRYLCGERNLQRQQRRQLSAERVGQRSSCRRAGSGQLHGISTGQCSSRSAQHDYGNC